MLEFPKYTEHAKAEGTSMNQYCLYLLSGNDAFEVNERIVDMKSTKHNK